MGYLVENLKDNLGSKRLMMLFWSLIMIVGLVVFAAFCFIYTRPPKDYIIVGESAILAKTRGKWVQIKKINNNILSSKYTVVSDSTIKDNVQINYSNDSNFWLYMDNQYNDLELKHVKLAYTDKFKNVKNADYQISYYTHDDESILSSALGDKDISNFENSIMRYSFDLDGDGKIESIYTLTDKTLAGYRRGKYSSMFLARDGKFVKTFSDDTSRTYKVVGIVDIDGDKKYEIIVNRGDLDVSYIDSCYQIYKVTGDKITMIMDCN